MPSILPGYEYDIFISYRQKDNKYDGWVTEFVANLRRELEATFKEDISIYFDENPHDGLLETHHVDKSLEGKLKCLILIPILSRTYCDPKSFAWINEFVAFNRLTVSDPIGAQVKLRNGNVASRVLPVRIHELGPDDIALVEKELKDRLRAIDFIYKEPGVNRALKPQDNKEDNLSKTNYRNQVNKVANAVNEIITGLKEKQPGDHAPLESDTLNTSPVRTIDAGSEINRRGLIRVAMVYVILAMVVWKLSATVVHYFQLPNSIVFYTSVAMAVFFPVAMTFAWFYERSPQGFVRVGSAASRDNPFSSGQRKPLTGNLYILLLLIVVVALYFFTPRASGNESSQATTDALIDKSIAVLPFTDISESHDQGYFTDGMMVEILAHLYKIKDLRSIPRTSTLKYKESSMTLKEIARELGVATLLEGSVRKANDRVRISVQLIDAEREQPLWQQTYEHKIADIFSVQSDVAQQIAASLQAQITPEVKLRIESIPTTNQNAYDLFLRAQNETALYWEAFVPSHINQAIKLYKDAVAEDPQFSNAYTGLGRCYWLLAHFSPDYTPDYWKQSKENIEKSIALDPNNGWAYSQLGIVQHLWDWDRKAALQSYKKAIELNPTDLSIRNDLLIFYVRIENCEAAEKELEFIKSANTSNSYETEEFFTMTCTHSQRSLLQDSAKEGKSIRTNLADFGTALFSGDYKRVIEFWNNEKDKPYNPMVTGVTGEAYALSGDKTMARRVIQQLTDVSKKQYVSKCLVAAIYMALGEEEKSYSLLEKALQERDYMVHGIFQFSVSLNNKMNDPRMRAFIERSWIPQAQ